MAAARAMLDKVHGQLSQDDHDHNTYILGRIGAHNVAITCLPVGGTGTSSAANVATQMLTTFKHLRFGLMVGVGGGVPSDKVDIRLGDVAVSEPTDTHGGTIQYDLGKSMPDGKFLRTGMLNKPGKALLSALSSLKAKHLMDGHDFLGRLSEVFQRYPQMSGAFARPSGDSDTLYEASYDHASDSSSCSQCSGSRLVPRDPRPSLEPVIHYGLIASGNQVMRDGTKREKLREAEGLICFEMEAAGLMDIFPCLVVRGICDYSDSHKHKIWQAFAAMMAACYAKELLNVISGTPSIDPYAGPETMESPEIHAFANRPPMQSVPFQRYSSPTPLGRSQTRDWSRDSQHNSSQGSMHSRMGPPAWARDSVPEQSNRDGSNSWLHGLDRNSENRVKNRSPLSADQGETQTRPLAERDFQEALSQFSSCLTAQQRTSFRLASLQGLSMTLMRIQDRLAAKSKAVNLPRLQVFLDGIVKLGKLSSFSETSEFISYVWGAIKFLFETTRNFYDTLDSLLDDYERIGISISYADTTWTWLMDNPQRDNILANIFGDILQFHMKVLGIVKIPTWPDIFKSVWTSLKPRREYILQDLRRYKELIENQSSDAEIHDYHQKRRLALATLEHIEAGTMKTESAEVFKWISGADNQEDHQSVSDVRRDNPGSGEWFLKRPEYVSWRMDDLPKMPVLWLSGILGAGKTVLASTAIADCLEDLEAHTAYCYCKYGDRQRTTFISIIKTILRQLLSSQNALMPWCYDRFAISDQLSPSERICKEMTRMALLNSGRAFIIVDGLDECEPEERKALLGFMGQMISECESRDPGKLRVMFTSRDEPDIRKHITTFVELAIKPNDNERDMKKFIRGWCQKIKANFDELSEGDLNCISTYTFERADGKYGMFLFAKLVMINLYAQIRLEDLLGQIQPRNFPKKLEDVYDRILSRISKNEHAEQVAVARKILGWMTCARRPLKWHEIQGAISTNLEDRTVNFSQRRLRIHIREICGSLINDLSGDRLELVHSTAKDYLVDSSFIHAAATECYLASLCLRYLTFECFDQDLNHDRHREFLLEGYYAFQDYAVTHWSDHTRKVIENGLTAFRPSDDDSEDDAEGDDAVEKCLPFKSHSFYGDMCHIFRHIQRQSVKGLRGLDEISPKPLESSIFSNRRVLESYSDFPNSHIDIRADLDLFYSHKWFKCSKATCYYFHEGFAESKSRDYHVTRHETPFRCRFEDCDMGHKLGFVMQRQLDKHLSIFHPESGKMATTFSKLKKDRAKRGNSESQSPGGSKHPAIFQCHLCPKRFTRKQALTHHLHVHSGEKPLQCRHCEQRFVRDSDRKRHEDRHRGEKKYNCRGFVDGILGPKTWGCGKGFLRADALASHLRSEAGRACLRPLIAEQESEKQWQSYVEERKAIGLDLPLPPQLYEQYPDLKLVNPDGVQTDADDLFGSIPESADSDMLVPESVVGGMLVPESSESDMLGPGTSGTALVVVAAGGEQEQEQEQEPLMPSAVTMFLNDEDDEMYI